MVVERDQRVTMVRKVKSLSLSSLLVFLNDWLNFRCRDQFEIKMLIARTIVTLTQHFLSSCHYFAAVPFAFVFPLPFVYSF